MTQTVVLRTTTTLLFIVFAYLFAVPVWDSDFWWHIATGQYIFETGAIPDADPFGVFEISNPLRSDTILKGYWLAQILFYGIYNIAGIEAMVWFRVTILLLSLFFIYRRMAMFGLRPWLVICMTTVAGFGLYGYTADRPQLFSTILMALTFWCVDRAETQNTLRPYLFLPLIALIWANMHGGAILGWVLLGAYAVFWGWQQYRNNQSLLNQRLMIFVAVVAAFGLATALTPNGLTTHIAILDFQGSAIQSRTSEYLSSLVIFKAGTIEKQVWVYVVLTLSVLGVIGLYKREPRQAIILLMLIVLSIDSYRYFVFLLVAGIPYAAKGIGTIIPSLHLNTQKKITRTDHSLSIATVVTSVALIYGFYNIDRSTLYESRFPVELSQQLEGKQGKVLSVMHWGGYLLWHNPGLTPYVDGRMLDDGKLTPYTHMLWVTQHGQKWLAEQDFDWVLLPYRSRDGSLYKLNSYLDFHPGWNIFAQNKQGVIFQSKP